MIKHFPYNLFETIFVYEYLCALDGEPPSYGFAGRVLGRNRFDVLVNARRIEALGLGKVHKAGRPFNIAWLELNDMGREMYDSVQKEGIPLALLADVSVPPSDFILKSVPDLNIVVLTRLDYFGMLDDIRKTTGTKHRSYSADALGGTGGRAKAPPKIGRIDLKA